MNEANNDNLNNPAITTTSTNPARAINTARIVPLIRGTAYLRQLRALELQTDPTQHHVYEIYNEELAIIYAEDKEDTTSLLKCGEVAALGLDMGSLKALALQNLSDVLDGIEQTDGHGRGQLMADGNYDASLLLVDELWNTNEFNIDGELIVAVPSRDRLLYTGSDDANNLATLQKVIASVFEQGERLVSRALFVRRNGRFEVFKPEEVTQPMH